MDVSDLFRVASERWDGVDVTFEAFSVFVAARVAGEPAESAIDLYLACACAAGDREAIERFDREYAGVARDAIRRVVSEPEIADEALQQLRVRLFVAAADRQPEIAGYSGRGWLAAWVRTAATRIALGLVRARRQDEGEGELEHVVADELPPELQLTKLRYGSDANTALRDAFAALDLRERNLLRQHFADRLGIDELGKLYGVHRATAARWLERARHNLERATRRLLGARLGVGGATADSIIDLVQSKLHITLGSIERES